MNDQEVKEYMHRFLDDDLSEEEIKQFERHLHESPGSAVLFERLKHLNSELEQLPRVTPPVSIVDSILPQLERAGLLDQPLVPDGGRLAAAAPPAARRPRRWRDRLHYKAAGSVVVAGIVLTLLIINAPELKVQTANDMAGGSMDNAASSSAETGMALKVSEQGDHAPMSADSHEIAMYDEAPPAGELEERLLASNDEPIASAEGFDTGAAPDYGGTPDGGEAIGVGRSANDGGNFISPTLSDPPMAGDGGGSRSQQPIAQEDLTAQEDVQMLPQRLGDPEPSAAHTEEQPGLEFVDESKSLLLAVKPVVSPSGELVASIAAEAEGDKIVIVDNDGLTVYESRVYAGALGQLLWSDDASMLTFEWITGEDTLLMAIDIRAKTEFVKE